MSTAWIIFIVVLSALLLILIALFLLFVFQERLIFKPEAVPEDYQFEFNLPFEELFFEPRKGVRLNAVLFKAKESKGLCLFFHGHSGSNAHLGLCGRRNRKKRLGLFGLRLPRLRQKHRKTPS